MRQHGNTYEQLREAKALLELPDQASMDDIRRGYHRLLKRWHPDVVAADRELCQQKTAALNRAYATLRAYCQRYRFSFSREEAQQNMPAEEWWRERFGVAPVWQDDDRAAKP